MKFKLIQTFMFVLVTCKKKKIHPKMKALEWSQHFSHYKSKGIFQTIRDFMVVLFTCMNKEDPIKNKGPRVVTRLFMNFSNTQGQLTQ